MYERFVAECFLPRMSMRFARSRRNWKGAAVWSRVISSPLAYNSVCSMTPQTVQGWKLFRPGVSGFRRRQRPKLARSKVRDFFDPTALVYRYRENGATATAFDRTG